MKRTFYFILFILVSSVTVFGQKKILFDNTHNEQANNADWVIDDGASRYPSPSQSDITASTPEDYWSGSLSSWGIALVKRGYWVETLPPSSDGITYGDSSNPQDLSNYDVFVVDEPNNPFTSTEKQAMIDFVQNGGGLFIIADHAGADRDHDGWDALEIWNDFFTDYSNPFGFYFDAGSNISDDPESNVANLPSDPILHGIAGDVEALAFYNGSTMTLDLTANSSAVGLVYHTGADNPGTNKVIAVRSTYGNGRVVGVGDSSVPEDNTSNGGTTYPGWIQPMGDVGTADDSTFSMNATMWLAGDISSGPYLSVNPSSIEISQNTVKNFSISGNNLDGSAVLITSPEDYEISLDGNNFDNSLNISYTAPTLSMTTIYVRMKNVNTPTAEEQIICEDNGSADNVNVKLVVNNFQELIDEDFSSEPTDWQICSVAGSKDWEYTSDYMYINAYNSDVACEDWFISPLMNFSDLKNIFINFDTWTQYSDNNIANPELRLFYSTDYPGTGNPNNYTWHEMSYSYPAENSQTWTNSGDVYFPSSVNGNVYVAFRYKSSGTGSNTSTLWKLDNIVVRGKDATKLKNISSDVLVYPNPVTDGILNIVSDSKENKTLEIISLTGKLLYRVNYTDPQKMIDLNFLNKGIYLMRLRVSNLVINKTILIN